MKLMRLDGQVALVTGGGRGVGRGIALELARAGCRVAVNYHASADLAEEAVHEIKSLGGDAFAVRADVAAASEVRSMVAAVTSRFRGLEHGGGAIVNIGSGCNKVPFPNLVFLASRDASFVSGQTLWVDGALFSQGPWACAEERVEAPAGDMLADGGSR